MTLIGYGVGLWERGAASTCVTGWELGGGRGKLLWHDPNARSQGKVAAHVKEHTRPSDLWTCVSVSQSCGGNWICDSPH